MRTKVCHITTVHPANDNRIFFKECTSLSDAGYEVVLLCANAVSTRRNGVQIIGFKGHRTRIKRFFLTSLFTAFNQARKVNAAIYHLHDPELVWTGILLRLCGKKVIMDVHENNAAAILSRPYVKAAFTRKLLSLTIKLIESITLPAFNGIVTARPDISALFPRLKPVTLRNFPVLPDYASIPDLELKKTRKAIIYVGGATRIRGITELIEAMDSVINAELWILGPFESPEYLHQCQTMKGWRNVRYLGIVEADKIFPYIKAADAGIITFLPMPNHITTLATKPFEYMACGLPVIMSNFDYWRTFFGDSAIYVDPAKPLEIAHAIDHLMEDEGKLNALKKMNLELARNEYNWQKEKEKLLDLYKLLIH